MYRFFVILMGLFLTLGCKETIDVVNGEVPSEYLAEAAPFMGTYRGKIDGAAAEVHLSLNGNKVVMSGTQPISNHCQSSYGNLKSLVVEKKDDKLKVHGASFVFNSNRCTVLGKEVQLSFDGNKLFYSLLYETRNEWRCGNLILLLQVPPVPPPPNQPPCRWEFVNYYIEGHLRK